MEGPNAFSAEDCLVVGAVEVLDPLSVVIAINLVAHFFAFLVQEVNHGVG